MDKMKDKSLPLEYEPIRLLDKVAIIILVVSVIVGIISLLSGLTSGNIFGVFNIFFGLTSIFLGVTIYAIFGVLGSMATNLIHIRNQLDNKYERDENESKDVEIIEEEAIIVEGIK